MSGVGSRVSLKEQQKISVVENLLQNFILFSAFTIPDQRENELRPNLLAASLMFLMGERTLSS